MFYVSKNSGFYNAEAIFNEELSIEVDADVADASLYALASDNIVHLISAGNAGLVSKALTPHSYE